MSCSDFLIRSSRGRLSLFLSYFPVVMTFTAVSLMTTTATLHQSFKISTASSAVFFFFNLIPFSTLIIESSHMHKQKPCLFTLISFTTLIYLHPLSRPNAGFSFYSVI